MLFLYNQKSGQKESFTVENRPVRMYVCGPTIYDLIHLGNARSLVCFDLLYRLLTHLFPDVCYVRNITDVDDKINQRAFEQGESIATLTQRTLTWFVQDSQDLGIKPPTHQPRATQFIDAMIAMIQGLIHKGMAYVQDSHVLFSVDKNPHYGQLSKIDLKALKAGARVEQAPYKDNPLDFVLWKPSKPNEPSWESPFGPGRPGWHIECSAMSLHFLGECFDIHGGGYDLLFPHHENERAQSCAFSGKQESARFWLYNGMLLVDGQKMSKSLGNFQTLRDALKIYPADILRWAFYSTHYRHPLDWTKALLVQASSCVQTLYRALNKAGPLEASKAPTLDATVLQALCDDLNTPLALSLVHKMAIELLAKPKNQDLAQRLFHTVSTLLGIGQTPPRQWLQNPMGLAISVEGIALKIEERKRLRQHGQFAEADRVREALARLSVGLEDRKDETFWYRLW